MRRVCIKLLYTTAIAKNVVQSRIILANHHYTAAIIRVPNNHTYKIACFPPLYSSARCYIFLDVKSDFDSTYTPARLPACQRIDLCPQSSRLKMRIATETERKASAISSNTTSAFIFFPLGKTHEYERYGAGR